RGSCREQRQAEHQDTHGDGPPEPGRREAGLAGVRQRAPSRSSGTTAASTLAGPAAMARNAAKRRCKGCTARAPSAPDADPGHEWCASLDSTNPLRRPPKGTFLLMDHPTRPIASLQALPPCEPLTGVLSLPPRLRPG